MADRDEFMRRFMRKADKCYKDGKSFAFVNTYPRIILHLAGSLGMLNGRILIDNLIDSSLSKNTTPASFTLLNELLDKPFATRFLFKRPVLWNLRLYYIKLFTIIPK